MGSFKVAILPVMGCDFVSSVLKTRNYQKKKRKRKKEKERKKKKKREFLIKIDNLIVTSSNVYE